MWADGGVPAEDVVSLHLGPAATAGLERLTLKPLAVMWSIRAAAPRPAFQQANSLGRYGPFVRLPSSSPPLCSEAAALTASAQPVITRAQPFVK